MGVFIAILLVGFAYVWKKEPWNGIESHLGNNVLTSPWSGWSTGAAFFPLAGRIRPACCALEMIVAAAARYDLAVRDGVFRPSRGRPT